MNQEILQGQWNEQMGKLKQKLALLIDDNRLYETGKKEVMFAKQQIRFGKLRNNRQQYKQQ